jgi:Flp pilus assembly protein TadB
MITMLLYAFIVLCIVGLILWGINQIPGIPPIIKTVIYVVVGVILLLWLLSFVQGGHGLNFHNP